MAEEEGKRRVILEVGVKEGTRSLSKKKKRKG